jgi:hypothetical protein
MTIELDDATAAVLWDICNALDNNLEDIGFLIREAVVAKPKLEDAFARAGYNEFALASIVRPSIPKLRLGDKYEPPTT